MSLEEPTVERTPYADVTRIVVATPQRRVEVAVPAEIPIVDLLSTLVRLGGDDLPDAGLGHGGWSLQSLGEGPLDLGKSLQDQNVRDGGCLFLRPRTQTLPAWTFDDVADAIATVVRDQT